MAARDDSRRPAFANSRIVRCPIRHRARRTAAIPRAPAPISFNAKLVSRLQTSRTRASCERTNRISSRFCRFQRSSRRIGNLPQSGSRPANVPVAKIRFILVLASIDETFFGFASPALLATRPTHLLPTMPWKTNRVWARRSGRAKAFIFPRAALHFHPRLPDCWDPQNRGVSRRTAVPGFLAL